MLIPSMLEMLGIPYVGSSPAGHTLALDKMEAVSFGLRIVHTTEELQEAVKFFIDEYQQQALVEKFICGRDFAVGLLGNDPPEAFPVLEFDLENDPDAIQSVDKKKQKPRKKFARQTFPGNWANSTFYYKNY